MTIEEEIINQSHKYRLYNPSKNKDFTYNGTDLEEAYESGAKWADKIMIEKACDWLEKHVEDFMPPTNSLHDYNTGELIHFFKKAMEE